MRIWSRTDQRIVVEADDGGAQAVAEAEPFVVSPAQHFVVDAVAERGPLEWLGSEEAGEVPDDFVPQALRLASALASRGRSFGAKKRRVPSRLVRNTVLSVAVALAGAAAITGVAWSVQTVALPPPARANRIAADTSRWLSEHRVIVDVFHVDRTRRIGLCVDGWYRLPSGKQALGSLLAMKGGRKYLVAGGKVLTHVGFRRRSIVARLGLVVGCATGLSRMLLPAEQSALHLHAQRAFAAGRPAIALRLRRGAKRFTLFVAPTTYEPLVAIFHTPKDTMTARLFLARDTPRLLRRFDVAAVGTRYRP